MNSLNMEPSYHSFTPSMKDILGKTKNELPQEKDHRNVLAYQQIKTNGDYRKYMTNNGVKLMEEYRKNM